MRTRPFLGALTRLALLLPLLGGAKADCGVSPEHPKSAAQQEREPDCHQGADAGHEDGGAPQAPGRHHDGGPLSGHCPAYHSCALDLTFMARSGEADLLDELAPPAPKTPAALLSLSALPEVPPPRA